MYFSRTADEKSRPVPSDLYIHQQGLDTTTPTGKAMFQMMGVFGELERALIREWIMAGLARARARGVHLGRPWIGQERENSIRAMLAQSIGIKTTARLVGCGLGTVQRVIRASRDMAS